ncbi:hypothetical protein [Catenulispora yoronensis]
MDDDTTIEAAKSGDVIGIDRMWRSVERCTGLNGWVTVLTAPYSPNITASWDTPVFLARRI